MNILLYTECEDIHMRKIEITLYSFDELSPKVQEKVLDRARETYPWGEDDNEQVEEAISSFVEEKFGIKMISAFSIKNASSIRGNNCIQFSLGYCQGDYVAFNGKLDLKLFVEKNEDIRKLVGEHVDNLVVKVMTTRGGFQHKVEIDDVEEALDENELDDLSDAIVKVLDTAAKESMEVGYSAIEDIRSDDNLKANFSDMEFLEDGTIWNE